MDESQNKPKNKPLTNDDISLIIQEKGKILNLRDKELWEKPSYKTERQKGYTIITTKFTHQLKCEKLETLFSQKLTFEGFYESYQDLIIIYHLNISGKSLIEYEYSYEEKKWTKKILDLKYEYFFKKETWLHESKLEKLEEIFHKIIQELAIKLVSNNKEYFNLKY